MVSMCIIVCCRVMLCGLVGGGLRLMGCCLLNGV